MILSKEQLKQISPQAPVRLPREDVSGFPEKVLQFGTGVLLRGLPDYFIDKANNEGLFRGRIVVVKSTSGGDATDFEKQDNLYTLVARGIANGEEIEDIRINASISRVLTAAHQWEEVMQCAENPDMQLVISNTTEVGIAFVDEDIRANPPSSFPAKLLAFLYRRYLWSQGDPAAGLVVVPTELIPDNADRLLEILLQLADGNRLEEGFVSWLRRDNFFCNSLVDRIVPGKLPDDRYQELRKQLGYDDALMIMAEPYRLWAIAASSPRVNEVLSFRKADEGMIVAENIYSFRELKLRLLNGTHTFSCGPAFLAGFPTVSAAMQDVVMGGFIARIMQQEIISAINGPALPRGDAAAFADKVLDRFRNPHIAHKWLDITLQYSSKMRMRNVPILLSHYEKSSEPPVCMSLAFAAYLLFMRTRPAGNGYEGCYGDRVYPVRDEQASRLHTYWTTVDPEDLAGAVLKDKELWGTDLSRLPGWTAAVSSFLKKLMEQGCLPVIGEMLPPATGAGDRDWE
ncbi:tagaturonate reductase [Compostibacter hankyongensis]|uniref:Tagaturonate reductase n=1 Tax=Compostibacter hankyongensis TaxID=1007089 RepID=A0ABP8FW93_9BACT